MTATRAAVPRFRAARQGLYVRIWCPVDADVRASLALVMPRAAIRERFSGRVADGNVAAATEAYEFVTREMEEAAHAQAD